uniref:Uncharacterized protein n=1 Tax=Chromera velia CCMP2878 TaxID=1169474 RepID=A0A0G4IBN7_9ALVE|eukprot:Cvel_2218.t1-p1 / transcript=Cvel_2218.t1 / gene=Cvel_2218 / organism=Chromera_velia_CCMP2878 / gene_product=hypothetical protein / transcript_product=hypothetical protein / location=Cvel_scaffold85:126598-127806(+) / protein_length=403 / sequence_SO=supercontig / SO=protein_coding / is_pseudo=false
MVRLLNEEGVPDGSEISVEDLPFSEDVSAKVSGVAVFNTKLYVDTAVEDGLETALETVGEDGKRIAVYFALSSVKDSCTLRHKGEEITCTVVAEESFYCFVKRGNEENGPGLDGQTLQLSTSSPFSGFRFVSVLGSVTMYVEEVPIPSIVSLPLWLVSVVASVSVLCMVGPVVLGVFCLRFMKKRERAEHGFSDLTTTADVNRTKEPEMHLDERSVRKEKNEGSAGQEAKIGRTSVRLSSNVEKGQTAEENLIQYSLKVGVDRMAQWEDQSDGSLHSSEDSRGVVPGACLNERAFRLVGEGEGIMSEWDSGDVICVDEEGSQPEWESDGRNPESEGAENEELESKDENQSRPSQYPIQRVTLSDGPPQLDSASLEMNCLDGRGEKEDEEEVPGDDESILTHPI